MSAPTPPHPPRPGGSETLAFIQSMQQRVAKRRQADDQPTTAYVDASIAAAAVLHVFDPARVHPAWGEAPAEPPTMRLIAASVPAVGWRREGLRTLRNDVRRTVLRQLGSRQRMRAALEQNPRRVQTSVQRLFETWLREEPLELGEMSFEDLECLRQLYEWGIEEFGGLPHRDSVERAHGWRSAVRVFEHLVDADFVGRTDELALLQDHLLGERPGRTEPLAILGVGGAGKTALLGKFLIDQFRNADDAMFPFAYLPFDAGTLDVREPYTILLSAATQISDQSGTASDHSTSLRRAGGHFRDVFADYRVRRGSLQRRASEHTGRESKIADLSTYEMTLYDAFVDLVTAALDEDAMTSTGRPALLVFDTFEEVTYRTAEDLHGFWAMMAYLLERLPRLRILIAGRGGPDQLLRANLAIRPLELSSLTLEDSVHLLRRLGIQSSGVAEAIARQIGGNPLSLRLAARVAQAENPGPGGLADGNGTGLSTYAVGSELARGVLYRRLLDHIHDPDVRSLAHPGMVLRRITVGVIESVLAPACDIHLDSPQRGADLFEGLRREQALVSLDSDGSLRYREDVRRPVLELLAHDKPMEVKRIHELAVEHYQELDSVQDRAEELYHRMMLDQPAGELEARWIPEAGQYIASAVDEIPVEQRRWLAGRMSLELPPEMYEQAELSEWERLIGRKAQELVRYDMPDVVLDLLRERPDRTPESPLFALEARVLLDMGNPGDATALLERALSDYPVYGNPGRLAELLWLRVQSARADGDDDRALVVLRQLQHQVRGFPTKLALVQTLTELLDLVNPGDELVEVSNPDVGPVRGELAAALELLTAEQAAREASLVRLALVRVGPHYPRLVARLTPAVVFDFGYLAQRGLLPGGDEVDEVVRDLVQTPTVRAVPELAGMGTSDHLQDLIGGLVRELTEHLASEGGADDDPIHDLTIALLTLLRTEHANLSGATLAGIEEYREPWELINISEVA